MRAKDRLARHCTTNALKTWFVLIYENVIYCKLLTTPQDNGGLYQWQSVSVSPEAKVILEPLNYLEVTLKKWIEQSHKPVRKKNSQLELQYSPCKTRYYAIVRARESRWQRKSACCAVWRFLFSVIFRMALQSTKGDKFTAIPIRSNFLLHSRMNSRYRSRINTRYLTYYIQKASTKIVWLFDDCDPKTSHLWYLGAVILVYQNG